MTSSLLGTATTGDQRALTPLEIEMFTALQELIATAEGRRLDGWKAIAAGRAAIKKAIMVSDHQSAISAGNGG